MYYIEPEIAGGLGEATIIDTSCHPPKIKELEYKFDGWLGDDILEAFPCYIITEDLAKAILANTLKGVSFKPVKTTKSDEFSELFPDLKLPDFQWLIIEGSGCLDDFWLTNDCRLAVSDLAFTLLKDFKIKHADITIFT